VLEEPHHPLTEQQFPKAEFRHVKPFVPPHVASVETAVAGVVEGVAGEATEEAEEGVDDAALVLVFEAAPLAVRYQFVDGSPRHSPNVTAL